MPITCKVCDEEAQESEGENGKRTFTRRRTGPANECDDDVRLEYYRLQKISEGSISLSTGASRALDGPTEVDTGLLREEMVVLSKLIDIVNERFGTDFNQADQLFFDQIVEEAITDEWVKEAAAVNPGDKFELVFKNLLRTLFVERIDKNEKDRGRCTQ